MSTPTHATVIPLPPRPAPADSPELDRPAQVGSLTYTVAEVAGMLRLNLGGTYRMIRSGDIPSHKLGNRWVIGRRAFHTWLDSQTEPRPAETAAGRRTALGELTDDEVELIWAYRNRHARPGNYHGV